MSRTAAVAAAAAVLAFVAAACGKDGEPKPGDDAAAPPSDGVVGDGNGEPGVDAPGGTGDASTAPMVGPACASTTCSNGTEDCCIGQAETCKPTGTCPSQGFACDGPEDCAGGSCCFGNGGTGGSECSAGGNCQIACHADSQCPAATPRCCPKSFTPGYKVCQTQC